MREPFLVHFKVGISFREKLGVSKLGVPKLGFQVRGVSDLEKLVLLGLHTQPTSAVVEIDALVDVVAWAEEVVKDSLSDIVILKMNRLATLKCLSLAILMLAGATSLERRRPHAGGSDKEKKGWEHLNAGYQIAMY